MPNGKPGDHPLTDVLVHGADVFSPEVDRLIREIARIGGEKELDRLVDWLTPPALPQMRQDLQAAYDRLLKDAKARGWDTSAAVPGAMAVEELLQAFEAQAQAAEIVQLWVPDRLVLGNRLVQSDFAMAIVTDKALELGFEPAGFEQGDKGRTYTYRK